MTTSNSTNFTQTRNEIIADALTLLGVYGQGDTVSANDYSFCSNILNKMVKAWEGQGIHLWTYEEGAVFLTEDQQSYSLSSSSTDIAGTDVVFTTLSADVTSGTSMTVESTIGMTALDNIGVKLDDNTIHWTTVASVDSSTALTLTSGLSSEASEGNNVFVFTNRIDRPLDITSIRYRHSSGTERPITMKSRDDFMRIPNKDTTGPANQAHYSPKVSDARLYVWPVCDDVGDCLRISYLRRIQDFDNSTDNPDLPQEWLEAITYNLAIRVSTAYGINVTKLDPSLALIASNSLAEMQLFDGEQGSLRVVPNYRYDE